MHSRRSVLTGCGAVLGTAALGGCSVLESGGGSGGGESTYTDWLYEASAGINAFSYADLGAMASLDGLPERLVREEFFGIPMEEMNYQVGYQSNMAYDGPFSADEFRSGVESTENITLEADGTYEGYDRYTVSEAEYEMAIQDGTAVVGPTDTIEQFIDAGAGDGDRLVDQNDDLAEVADELGVEHTVNGRVKLSSDAQSQGLGENRVATGQTIVYGSDTTEFERVVVFDSEDAVDAASVRSRYESQESVSDPETTTNGRRVVLTYSVETSDL